MEREILVNSTVTNHVILVTKRQMPGNNNLGCGPVWYNKCNRNTHSHTLMNVNLFMQLLWAHWLNKYIALYSISHVNDSNCYWNHSSETLIAVFKHYGCYHSYPKYIWSVWFDKDINHHTSYQTLNKEVIPGAVIDLLWKQVPNVMSFW